MSLPGRRALSDRERNMHKGGHLQLSSSNQGEKRAWSWRMRLAGYARVTDQIDQIQVEQR